MADSYPHIRIRGIDLFAIQPTMVPLNCIFQVDDLDPDYLLWDFSTPFDFIHARDLKRFMQNWARFYNECYRNLTPGGQIELGDHDFKIRSEDPYMHVLSPNMDEWSRIMFESFTEAGRPIYKTADHERCFRSASFVNITS